MDTSNTQPSEKVGIFSDLELDLIKNCRTYAANDPAGLPGHNLMVIITKMSDALNLLMLTLPAEERDRVVAEIAKMHDLNSAVDPGKILFGQIKDMMERKSFVRRDLVGQKRTAEEVAKAQGRNVVYICPDGTIRNKDAEIIGRGGRFYEDENEKYYRESIPVSFANEDTFNEWIDSIVGPPQKKTDSHSACQGD